MTRSDITKAIERVDVETTIKWFSADKGWGFVTFNGEDCFLHASVIERCAFDVVQMQPGAVIRVDIERGPRGASVAFIHKLVRMGSDATPPQANGFPVHSGGNMEREPLVGQVKWFDTRKGYGFINVGGSRDVYVNQRSVMRSGLKTLREAQRVRCIVVEDERGLSAKNIELAE